jgi:hypothetical protein
MSERGPGIGENGASPWPLVRPDGSPRQYAQLDYDSITNMQWQCTPRDPARPLFVSSRACVQGRVEEVISEPDGDSHIWLTVDGAGKGRLACEIPTDHAGGLPSKGDRIRAFGILRYDLKHSWAELHPVEAWERVK